jgi:uncharacterized protein (TIRG00374 family)
MRRQMIIAITVVMSVALLVWTLNDLNLQEVGEHIAAANPALMLLSVGSVVLSLACRAVRWRGLLDDTLSTGDAFHKLNVGMMLNQLPMRAGEVARSVMVMRVGIPFVTGATSIVVERLLDVVMVLILLAWSVARLPSVGGVISTLAIAFGAAAITAFVVLVWFARSPDVAHAVLGFFEQRLTFLQRLPLRKLLDQMLAGLKPLTHARNFAHAVVWTLISWAVSISTYYIIITALNVPNSANLDLLLMCILGMSLASFSIALPITVAGVGAFHGAIRIAGEQIGLASEYSASFGILSHAVAVGTYAILGVIGMLILGVSFGSLLNSQDAPKDKNQDAPKDKNEGTAQ